MMAVAVVLGLTLGWPSLFTDCSVFPELGETQPRPTNHPPMALLCIPKQPPASFEFCSNECKFTKLGQNCSRALCSCKERCMGTAEVCTGSGASKDPTHKSLPDALNARQGTTKLLLNGRPPQHYVPGTTYEVQVVAGADDAAAATPNASTWFLLDAGVGALSTSIIEGVRGATAFKTQCNGTRASFEGTTAKVLHGGAPAATMYWTVPRDAQGALVLRVAAATSMGNVSVNAAVLRKPPTPDPPPLPAGAMGYACTTMGRSAHVPWKLQQCQSVPPGTFGAVNQSACEQDCFAGPGTYVCTRCAHVYDPKENNGIPFDQLPDTWKCPVCGAPKSAYAKEVGEHGRLMWVHRD